MTSDDNRPSGVRIGMWIVGAGVGIGVIPVSAEHLGVPGVVLLPIADAPALPLGLAWRSGERDPAVLALTGLVERMKGTLAEMYAPGAAGPPQDAAGAA